MEQLRGSGTLHLEQPVVSHLQGKTVRITFSNKTSHALHCSIGETGSGKLYT